MIEINADKFHKLYGVKRPRMVYQKKDFLDYVLMLAICFACLVLAYGAESAITLIGAVLCLILLISFPVRHGLAFSMPALIKQPQSVLYTLLHKIQNISPVYIFAVTFLALENVVIYLTPNLPHYVDLMRDAGFILFYLHLVVITVYRTISLVDHLKKKKFVKEFLKQTPWRRVIKRQPNISLEIFHAYFTGLLTHILLVAPWFMVLTYVNFSVLLMPLVCFVNFKTNKKFLKYVNAWFYRDHWLGHNSEVEFLYSHGSHHDAIPVGLIAVAGNGFLEGFMRHVIGYPNPFFNPLMAAYSYTVVVKGDIDLHQYVPGIFPKLSREIQKLIQHSIHHLGSLQPYGLAAKLDQPGIAEFIKKRAHGLPDEFTNSATLDEQLNGFEWDNPVYRKYLILLDTYMKDQNQGHEKT